MTSRIVLFPLALAGVLAAVVPVATQRGRGAAAPLPEGNGKALVEAQCSRCHTLNNLTSSWGYTRDGWERLFSTMVALPDEQRTTIADYLATNFPEQPRPPAVIIPGQAKVSFKEWVVPTLGSRPHDPLATPDGIALVDRAVGERLGRVDPKTGAIKEFPLQTPGSGPHGLTADKDGNIWFTGELEGLHRQARSQDRRGHRIPDARSRGARSAHAALRPEGHPVVHAAGREHGRPARSADRRHEAVDVADAAVAAVRHGGQLEGRAVLRRVRRQQGRAASIRTRWRSPNTRCRTPTRVRAASRSPATT